MIALLGAAGALVLVASALLGASRVRRLHRLHQRLDAARAGLDAALDRRALLCARSGIGPGAPQSGAPCLGPAASGAPRSTARDLAPAGSARCPHPTSHTPARPRTHPGMCADAPGCARSGGEGREDAANALGRALAALDRAALGADLRAELAEAEELLVLARHVHNEAVRDTLALRSRRMVRWLRLAGTAPMPRYFETVDPADVTRAAAPGPGA